MFFLLVVVGILLLLLLVYFLLPKGFEARRARRKASKSLVVSEAGKPDVKVKEATEETPKTGKSYKKSWILAGTVVSLLIILVVVWRSRSREFEGAGYILEIPDPPRTVESIEGGAKITFDTSIPSVIPTGIRVNPGQTVSFQASGRYHWDAKVPESWVGPAGASWTPLTTHAYWQFPLPNVPIASVIGYIGGEPFFIGEYKVIVAKNEGEIILGLNERQGNYCYQDNRGQITVSIETK